MRKQIWKNHFNFMLFILPALFLFGLFSIYPVLSSLFYSMTNFDGISGQYKWIYFQNFIDIFTNDSDLRTAVGHNIIWVINFMILQNALALFFAVLLDQKIRFRNLYRSIFFLPVVISTVAVSFVWCYIYSPNIGSLNGLLDAIGLHKLTADWLGDYNLALYSVMFVDIWKSLGFNIVLFLAGLQNVPTELIESASIDGASAWRKLKSVTLPIIVPTIGLVMVLSANSSLRAFDTVYLITQEGPGDATSLYMTRLINEAFVQNRYGYASAMAWVIFIVLLIFAWVQTKITQEKGT